MMDNILYKVNHKFKSDKSTLNKVEPLVYELKNVVKISDEKFYNILIAVTEAVNNAIMHGNKNNPDKLINVIIVASDQQFEITIEDEGVGFDPAKLPDPRSTENLLKEHGRGVFLIKSLADDVNFEKKENGTSVQMKFILKRIKPDKDITV